MLAYYRYNLRINQAIEEHQKEILAGVCIGGFPECRSGTVWALSQTLTMTWSISDPGQAGVEWTCKEAF